MKRTHEVAQIGVAQTQYRQFNDKCDYQNDVNTIMIDEEYEEGLLGTELFSHLFCTYYQHRQSEWKEFAGHSSDEQVLKLTISREPTCRGVFSKRSPARPAKLGSCIVTLVRREGRKLFVKGLDALDGSPVLDLKPYIPDFDAFPLAIAPMHWCMAQTSLLESARSIHWDTVNVTMALGLRAGMKALQLLSLSRLGATHATVKGPAFFAHGIEAVTGCSVLRGQMDVEQTEAAGESWTLSLAGTQETAEVVLRDGMYSDAGEVLTLNDDILFGRCEVVRRS